MNRTFRRMLISTGLGAAALALLLPTGRDAQAQDSTMCMQDVERLRAEPTAGTGANSPVDAWANAAEEACMAGDYGLASAYIASAYIADAERRLNLKEAQRDESGATATDGAATEAGGAGSTDRIGSNIARAGGTGDRDESFAEETGDEIADTAKDVGDEIGDAAEDVGDAIGDAFD